MSKSSVKTKTVLTITDMTESIELQAFKRPNDGYCKIAYFYFILAFFLEDISSTATLNLLK